MDVVTNGEGPYNRVIDLVLRGGPKHERNRKSRKTSLAVVSVLVRWLPKSILDYLFLKAAQVKDSPVLEIFYTFYAAKKNEKTYDLY